MNYKAICLTSSLWLCATSALSLELCGDFRQGEIIIGKTNDNATSATLNNQKKYPITNDGYFIFAFGRDQKKQAELTINYPDKQKKSYPLDIATYKWKIEHIKGISQSKVTPSKSSSPEIKREQKDVRRSVTTMQAGDYWREGFILPLKGRMSGEFGNQRIFNNIPKSPHSGTDIAAPEGTPVKASGSGKVILSGKNYFYTGNMVIIDHGQGLQTIYAHLKTAKVKAGDIVKQGQIIGLVGKTGRATGPHLHWGASLNNVRFRPHSLLNLKTKKCKKF